MTKLTKAQLKKFLTQPETDPYLSEEQLAKAKSKTVKFKKASGFQQKFDVLQTQLRSVSEQERLSSVYCLLREFGTEAIEVFTDSSINLMCFDGKSANALIDYHIPSAVNIFLADIANQRRHLLKVTKKYPLYTLCQLLNLAPKKGSLHSHFLLSILATYPKWEAPLREHCSAEQTKVLNRLLTFEKRIADANVSEVPRCLTGDVYEYEPTGLYLPSLPQLVLTKIGLAIPQSYLPKILGTLSTGNIAYSRYSKNEASGELNQLKKAITKQSLASFCRTLFHWYDHQDRPSKYRWMFNIQGITGDDETARLLLQVCKRFRADNNRVGACDALDMLTDIGSDTALMYINEFATQKRYQGLRERAENALTHIANERGLSMAELADRTVPDLGLDKTGKLMLDFGARQFIVSFNEFLQPQIFEADHQNLGKLRKTLPKPAKKDDATLATSATEHFRAFKKQLKSIASMQIKRLEIAMCDERKWSFDDFNRFFVQHPLIRHLTQRLVWGMYKSDDSEKNKLVGLCRITEELTFTDENDDDLSVNTIKDYQFGIAHIIDIPSELAQKFANILQEYEILQPFEQLARNTYHYSEDDVTTSMRFSEILAFWQNKKITYGSIQGLQQRHWTQEVGDGGMVYCFNKTITSHGKENTISFMIDEGWFVTDPPSSKTEYAIAGVYLAKGKFSELSKVAYSEMQRDLHLLAWFE